MSDTCDPLPSRRKQNRHIRQPPEYVVTLRKVRFLAASDLHHRQRVAVRFHFHKQYVLSCRGVPHHKLTSLLHTFLQTESPSKVQSDPSTTDQLTSEEEINLTTGVCGSKSSSSASEISDSQLPAAGTRSAKEKQRVKRTKKAQKPSASFEPYTQKLVDSDPSQQPAQPLVETEVEPEGTPDTVILSDCQPSSPELLSGAEAQTSAESSSSDEPKPCSPGLLPQGKSRDVPRAHKGRDSPKPSSSDEPKAGTSKLGSKGQAHKQKKLKKKAKSGKSSSPDTSVSAGSPSEPDNRQLCSWSQEQIPQALIGARAYYLFQKAIEKEPKRKTPTTPRQFNFVEFAVAAEESLAHERLTLELYSAERLPFAETPYLDRPRWAASAYSFQRYSSRLTRVFNSVNTLRRDSGETLDGYLDYYWNLTQRGHELYKTKKETDAEVVYNPSIFREQILFADVQTAVLRGFLKSY
jgi:hypothetical protein